MDAVSIADLLHEAAETHHRDLSAEITYLTRALKAPTLRDSVDRLAERAVTESCSHLEFLVACLQREVPTRESHGGEGRIRAARFPARKSLEEFDFDHARGLKCELIAHLGTLDFVAAKETWSTSNRPAPARPTSRSDWRSAPAKSDTGSCSPPPPTGSPALLAEAHHAGRLRQELVRLGRYPRGRLALGGRAHRVDGLSNRDAEPMRRPAETAPM